jgi:diacylglycerol kinase family enzyme
VERATNLHRGELLTTLRAALPGLGVAVAAFVLALATIVVSLFGQPLDLVVSLAGLVVATCLAIAAVLAVGPIRTIAVIAAFASAALTPWLLLLTGEPASAVVVVLLLGVAAEGARRAVRAAIHRPPAARIPGARVGPSTHPVLLANPRSGGGTAERVALADEAHRRGIEYVVLGPGDDLQRRAEEAVQRGADVLGMAGGDGSQGLVAQVALAHDLAFVCVPVGTRNHFAKDLGLDPGDPVAALDAFGDAEEIRIDLGLVADRVFVNNVSFGVYAMIVGTAGYRENKPVTAWQVLPSVLGPEAGPVDLRFTGPDGRERTGFQLILVSNGPYRFTADSRFGSRERMDLGVLGIVAARAGEGDDFPAFAAAWWAGQRDSSGAWLQWEASEFEVRSAGPIPAGVDGEALVFDPPLRLRSLPGPLRVRVPATARTLGGSSSPVRRFPFLHRG